MVGHRRHVRGRFDQQASARHLGHHRDCYHQRRLGTLGGNQTPFADWLWSRNALALSLPRYGEDQLHLQRYRPDGWLLFPVLHLAGSVLDGRLWTA